VDPEPVPAQEVIDPGGQHNEIVIED